MINLLTFLNFFKENKIMFGIVILVILVAIISVIFGILKKFDKGMMKVEGKTIFWDRNKLPLIVYFTDETTYLKTIISKILTEINKVCDNCVFIPDIESFETKQLHRVDILFQGLDEDKDKIGGRTDISYDKRTGEILSCKVFINSKLSVDDSFKAIRHEIGHALGLAHDDDSKSIMFPTFTERCLGFTSKDKKLLKKVYGKES